MWNMYDDEIDEEESLLNYHTDNLENIFFVISKLLNEREKYINTDYAVTGWVLFVIPHIREDFFNK